MHSFNHVFQMDGISLEPIIRSETLLLVRIHITNDIIHDRVLVLLTLTLENALKLLFTFSAVGTVINNLTTWLR
jgi:hypothetical protein